MSKAEEEDIKDLLIDTVEYAFKAAENGEDLEEVKKNILDIS